MYRAGKKEIAYLESLIFHLTKEHSAKEEYHGMNGCSEIRHMSCFHLVEQALKERYIPYHPLSQRMINMTTKKK